MAEYTPLHNDIEQSTPLPPPPSPSPMNVAGKPKPSRIASLDVFRGLCVFLMMVVDYGGSIFPSIAHAPWNGLHLADFVMPFFLFIAGLSLALAYKKVGDQKDATKKAIARAAKLFLLGVFLQGGYLHGAKSLTYGVDIMRIRWMGILQRISIAYLVAALCEIWLPCRKWGKFGIVRSYFWQWCLALLLSSVYVGLLYGLYVPDWEVNMSNSGLSLPAANETHVHTVNCGSRGILTPACNSAGMIDRYVLGINHLYAKPAYKNLKVCNKSKEGLIPEDSPSWCHAPFDPEGILGSLTAAVSCIIGLQFGHILVQKEDHKERLHRWSILSTFSFILGLYLVFTGIPLNKSLFTVSYVLVTSACAGFIFCLFYLLVDVWGYRWLTVVLEWIGVHALSIFVLLTSNLGVIVLQGFYWRTPENNLVNSFGYKLFRSRVTITSECFFFLILCVQSSFPLHTEIGRHERDVIDFIEPSIGGSIRYNLFKASFGIALYLRAYCHSNVEVNYVGGLVSRAFYYSRIVPSSSFVVPREKNELKVHYPIYWQRSTEF